MRESLDKVSLVQTKRRAERLKVCSVELTSGLDSVLKSDSVEDVLHLINALKPELREWASDRSLQSEHRNSWEELEESLFAVEAVGRANLLSTKVLCLSGAGGMSGRK
jgi:hypothetical protein